MNTTYIKLKEILKVIPLEEFQDRDFIEQCMEAWKEYRDDSYSTPHWKLAQLEDTYQNSVARVTEKYGIKNQTFIVLKESDGTYRPQSFIARDNEAGKIAIEIYQEKVYNFENGEKLVKVNFIEIK